MGFWDRFRRVEAVLAEEEEVEEVPLTFFELGYIKGVILRTERGVFLDDPAMLRAVADYLEEHNHMTFLGLWNMGDNEWQIVVDDASKPEGCSHERTE